MTSDDRNQSTFLYVLSAVVATIGLSYASVPLYRLFCSSTGYGGTVKHNIEALNVESNKVVHDRVIKVVFTADRGASMRWNFTPSQSQVLVRPGETALAFYRARNPTSSPIVGISTYNVLPFAAGAYFQKIQCFCFEEQILSPKEEVELPVFFYIDPEIHNDPSLESCDTITLSYTFFEAKEGLQLPFFNTSTASKNY